MKTCKITPPPHHCIITKAKSGKIYYYLRYRNSSTELRESLPSDFGEQSARKQNESYQEALQKLNNRIGLSSINNRNPSTMAFGNLIDIFLTDYYRTNISSGKKKVATYESYLIISKRLEKYGFSSLTTDQMIATPICIKSYFDSRRENHAAKSTIDKEVLLIKETLKFGRFDAKWISANDYDTIIYYLDKYKALELLSTEKRDNTFSYEEAALFYREVMYRVDTTDTYTQLFIDRLSKENVDNDTYHYIMNLLVKSRSCKSTTEISDMSSINIPYARSLFERIQADLSHVLETQYMPGTNLFYPLTRYIRTPDGSLSAIDWKDYSPDTIISKYEITHKSSRATSSTEYYYTSDGCLNALLLLFILATGLRFNEARSLKVEHIMRRGDGTYYILVKEQIVSAKAFDEDGKEILEGKHVKHALRKQSPKTAESSRYVVLNSIALEVLHRICEVTGESFFLTNGNIDSSYNSRFLFVNYNQSSRRGLGREVAYYGNFKSKLSYHILIADDFNITKVLFRCPDIENDDVLCVKQDYLKQLEVMRNELLFSRSPIASYKLAQYVYVIKPPALPSNSNVNKTLKRILANMRYRVPDETASSTFSIHSLRKTFATLLFFAGNDTKSIGNILGHSGSSEVTEEFYINQQLSQDAAMLSSFSECITNLVPTK